MGIHGSGKRQSDNRQRSYEQPKSGALGLRFCESFFSFQMSDAFIRYVMAILYTLPVDFGNSFVGFGFRFFQCGGQGHHIQDTAAINHVFSIFLYSACMEYDTACLFCLIQSGDDFAGGMGTD